MEGALCEVGVDVIYNIKYNIQMEDIGLTDREVELWGEIGEEVIASEGIRRLALQYYVEYREHLNDKHLANTHVFDNDHLANLFRIAYLLSEKQQETFDIKGDKISPIALSVNSILKKSHSYEDFLYHLKEIIKVATIHDPTVKSQIDTFIKRFSFTMTFHSKFVSTFPKIKPSTDTSSIEQSLLWLIFVLAKKLILNNQNDIIDTTCLMAVIFMFYIKEKTQHHHLEYMLEDPIYGAPLSPETVEHVFLQYFRLKDMGVYSAIFSQFNVFIKSQLQAHGIERVFDSACIDLNYKKLDICYQKKLREDSIDERHFLRDRINTVLNANRFTPFGGRRTANKVKSSENCSKIISHRVLNYDQQSGGNLPEVDIPLETGTEGIFKNLNLTKTPYKNMVTLTPMAMAMQMHNWVLEKSNYYKFQLNDLLRSISCESEEADKTMKMISGLWKDLCESLKDKGELTQTDRKVYLVLSSEIVYYVVNSTTNPIELALKQLKISWYQIWQKIDAVLRYDPRMPTNIKVHLLGLETSIISIHLWKSQSILFSIFNPELGNKLRQTNPQYERLFNRILHQLVYQIYFLSKKLELTDQITDEIFQLSQFVIKEFPELAENRHLNHVVLCSAYAVCRAQNLDVKFHTILKNYKELNNLSKEAYNEIVERIPFEGEEVDIITFYNRVYIKKTKQFLLKIKYERTIRDTGKEYKVDLGMSYLNSSVKELLPQNMVVMAEKITRTPGGQTPLTQALLAYNQSPLLKEKRIKNIGNYVDGKRLFEQKATKQEQLSMISKKFGTKKGQIKTTAKKPNPKP